MTMNIKEALKWASSFLEENNIAYHDLEAEVFIKNLYSWDKTNLYLNLNKNMSQENELILKGWLERRLKHEPIQYIVGSQDFYGRTFKTDPNVLIPRPETEILIEALLKRSEEMWPNKTNLNVADIGVGSGAIAITLKSERNNWNVYAIDISNEALEVAKHNAINNNVNITFLKGNMLTPIIDNGINLDIIVSNPPYIPSKDINYLMKDVKGYEPVIALDGGEDGLKYYREIIDNSKKVLNKPGLVCFEIGINQSENIETLLINSGAESIAIIKDFQDIPRIVIGIY